MIDLSTHKPSREHYFLMVLPNYFNNCCTNTNKLMHFGNYIKSYIIINIHIWAYSMDFS